MHIISSMACRASYTTLNEDNLLAHHVYLVTLMCPHTLSLSVNDYIIVSYFTAYYTENKRWLPRMRTQ